MTSLRLAFKELIHNYSFSALFVLSLGIGLIGLTSLDSLRSSIRESLNRKSKGFLAADLGVGARRRLKPEELKLISNIMPVGTETSQLHESLTMVAGVSPAQAHSSGQASRLTELRVVESNYPFFGEIELERQGLITSNSKKDLFVGPKVWVYPELLLQLGVKVGDQVKIGDREFEVSDTILRDSAGAGSDVSFAPPVYISRQSFEATRLDAQGSLGYYTLLARLPGDAEDEKVELLAKRLNKELNDPGIQITTPKDSSEQIGRVLNYLGDYLNLAGLVALLLSSIGQFYLLRNYFSRRLTDMAIYKSLGLAAERIFAIYAWQMVLLTIVAVVPTIAITAWTLPRFTEPLHRLLNIDLALKMPLSTALIVATVGVLQSLTLTLPYLNLVRKTKVRDLLQATSPSNMGAEGSTGLSWPWFIPAAVAFVALAFILSHSFYVGSIFIAALTGGALILTFIATLTLRILNRFRWSPMGQLSLKHMVRSRAATISAFLALALGILLSNLIPQVEAGIREEISTPPGVEQPSLFLFDIQDEQVAAIKQTLADLKVQPMQSAPMVRARLTQINGAPFSKPERETNWSREKENENRSRNRGYNLSYRDELSKSESIVEGAPFQVSPTAPTQISIETRFAARLGLKPGDHLTFDVQGVDITGTIVNLRKVRWTSFQPNFFIQFNSGPLDLAPKTHLITLQQMSLEKKAEIQRQIVKDYPNVAILDVTRIVERLLSIINQLGLALKVMATFTMLVGLSILFFVTYNQLSERKKEANLFKVLGASEGFIQRVFLTEVLLLVGLAIIAGTLLSYLIGFLLSYFLFENLYQPDFISPIYLALTVVIVSLATTYFLLRSVLSDRPRNILQSV